MTRIPPAMPAVYAPIFGRNATFAQQVYANSPDLALAFAAWTGRVRSECSLDDRLVELVRLRVAFHNQCRSCMAVRYLADSPDGLPEEVVCSLEQPADASDLADREKVAIAVADLMATDHLAIDDKLFAILREHFTSREQMDLLLVISTFVGYGRMGAVLDLVDELPEVFRQEGEMSPWDLSRSSPSRDSGLAGDCNALEAQTDFV